MSFYNLCGLSLSCLCSVVLVGCGSISHSEKRRLETVELHYSATTKGEPRQALHARMGKPNISQKSSDTWETVADESNGEKLQAVYDRSTRVTDGHHVTWRGDHRGWIRWRRETTFYLRSPQTSTAAPPPLQRRYAKHEFLIP